MRDSDHDGYRGYNNTEQRFRERTKHALLPSHSIERCSLRWHFKEDEKSKTVQRLLTCHQNALLKAGTTERATKALELDVSFEFVSERRDSLEARDQQKRTLCKRCQIQISPDIG